MQQALSKQPNNTPRVTINPDNKALEDEEERKRIEKEIKKSYRWNEGKEEIFRAHRFDAKQRLYKDVRSSSFNEVGFSPLVQASQMNQKIQLQRDVKLSKYMNGEALSADDLKFLANTSRSLMQFVDK